MKFFFRVFPYVKKYPVLAFGTLGCAILSTLLLVVFPAVTQRIVDDVITGSRPELLVPLLLAGLGAFFFQDLLNSVRIILNNHFEQKVIFDLRSDLYSHIQRLPLQWFDNRSTGDIMTRLVEDVTSVERVLIDGIEQGTVAVLQILIVAGLMLAYSPTLMVMALLPVPLLAIGALTYTLTARNRYRLQRRAASELSSLIHDNIAGIRQIKTYTSEEREHGHFNGVSEKLRQATLIVMRAWALYNPSMNFLTSLGMLLIAGFGAYKVLAGQMDDGVLVAFLIMARYLYEPVGRLHQLNQIFQSGRAAGERVFEILDSPTEIAEHTASPGTPAQGDIRFEGINFSYAEDRRTLENINLHATPGQMIALVGPTGAGKSTIVNLLTRFYEYDAGQILLDGRAITEIPRSYLRANIAMVTQESFLFNGTTAENLLIGKPDATEEEMWKALAAANAAEFVKRMPKGLHSEVGERGIRLSVGEKQRISIARALLKNPPILILDEATASVDPENERELQAAIAELTKDKTIIMIAHRLSTVRNADQILVLDKGRIVQCGTHRELMEEQGLYRRFIQMRETAIGWNLGRKEKLQAND